MMKHVILQRERLHRLIRIPDAKVRIFAGEDSPFVGEAVELGGIAAPDTDEILNADATFQDAFEEKGQTSLEAGKTVRYLAEEWFAVDES